MHLPWSDNQADRLACQANRLHRSADWRDCLRSIDDEAFVMGAFAEADEDFGLRDDFGRVTTSVVLADPAKTVKIEAYAFC